MNDAVGDRFQAQTRYDRQRSSERHATPTKRPEPFLVHPGARTVPLPSPQPPQPAPSFHETLLKRHSVRTYQARPIELSRLSYLLWAANGIQGTHEGLPARTVPSAGALYPVEVYLAVNDVVGLEPGVYHYAVRTHTLELILQERVGEKLVEATLGQTMCGACPVVFAWTAVVERCRCKYGQRAYRYIYLEAGHAAQNLALTAAALGLGSCQIGALYDEEVEKILGVNGNEEPVLYLSTVGYPR